MVGWVRDGGVSLRVESRVRGTRRAGMGCGAALIVGVVVVLCVSVVSAAVFALSPTHSSGLSTPFIPRQPGAIPWNGRTHLNILMMGGPSADIMMIVSYDPVQRSLQLFSMPGNVWMTIPGVGQTRISQAYVNGGGRLALLVAQTVVHVPIPYYVFLNDHAFSQVVDALGGLSVPGVTGNSRVSHHLTGGVAAAYISMRRESRSSEIERMQRAQQVVLAALRSASQPSVIFKIPTIVNALGGSIPTNFPYDEVPALVHAATQVPQSRVQFNGLNYANGAVSDYAGDGGHVLLPDWQHIGRVSRRDLFRPSDVNGATVSVVNGGGVIGQASNVAGWLRQAGLHVTGYASAGSFAHPRTEVQISRSAPPSTVRVARTVATLLQVPLTSHGRQRATGEVEVLLGRDFVDPTQQ
ncbi:MAG: LCP family protein [Chloroflexota bacterium]